MTKRQKAELPDVTSRVVWLLNNLWNGNRSKMAEAVGCTHSVLTKIAAGQQGPGRRLLDLIAAHSKVNPHWLMSGEGEPLLQERSSDGTAGWPLPITQTLLGGPPDQNTFAFGGESFPVAGAFYRPSRYWLRIDGNFATGCSTHHVIADDLLLMESDPTWWSKGRAVDGRLCVVRTASDTKTGLELALASFWDETVEEPARLSVDSFDRPTREQHKPRRQSDAWSCHRNIGLVDIVAVSVLLVRL